MRKFALYIIIVAGIVFSACKNQYEGIPDVNVDIYLNLQNPEYQKLNGIGSWVYTNGGSRGIIVFRSDVNTFSAYDRHCTYDSESSCAKVSVDASNLHAEDTCCDSRFQLIDGSPVAGPAPRALKAYKTSFDGNIVHIWN